MKTLFVKYILAQKLSLLTLYNTANNYGVASQQATKGFVQLGHDLEAIIGCAYPSFSFGGRNSAGQYF